MGCIWVKGLIMKTEKFEGYGLEYYSYKEIDISPVWNEESKPKPVERITMAEVKYALNDYEFWPLSQIEVMEELKAYIEYLEANQKDK